MKVSVGSATETVKGVQQQIKNIHLSMYQNDKKTMPELLKNNYGLFITAANAHVGAILIKADKNKDESAIKDIVTMHVVAENKAIAYTHQVLSHIRLEHDIAHAKEKEALRAALTLIQSKAIVSGNTEIEKIAQAALNEKSDFAQSSQELQKMLADWEQQFTEK